MNKKLLISCIILVTTMSFAACGDNGIKEVVPTTLEYDYMGAFVDGRAWVEKDGKGGYIDETGELIIPLQYDGLHGDSRSSIYISTGEFADGFARVSQKVDETGHETRHGFIDKFGAEVIPIQYIDAASFSEEFAAVQKEVQIEYPTLWGTRIVTDEKWGYIDKNGNEITPFIYEEASSFNEGMARVRKDEGWGYIDTTGEEAIPCQFFYAFSFSEGLAAATVGNGTGFIDTKGNWVIEPKYADAGYFRDGLAPAMLDYPGHGGAWGFIDTNDNLIIDYQFEAIIRGFINGFAVVETKGGNGRYSEIDKTGKVVAEDVELQEWDQRINGNRLIAKLDDETDLWGYIDQGGGWAVEPSYEDARPFSEGLAVFGKGGKYGILKDLKYKADK